ncbi:hypothetical protein WOLCODRAFT_152900 [Wolfiporia cocos MD-104 SS10]|uniref:RlpA-like protein double-psi beta-barrel domain-containing protein n=1 Tax=Wolfiporia cocos (strain MD-104) TaxID=742152 RepID=A0A2H3K1E7_WOLCO|nr:hypothetical protein WOLCODRAFT_152900 [Wolfiporia cocos MD-104 SS10]
MLRFQIIAAIFTLAAGVIATPMLTHTKRQNVGEATYYHPGEGACGHYNTSDQPVLALSVDIWNNGKHCLQWVELTDPATGITQRGQVVDECQGCDSTHVDLSPSLFESLGAPLSLGVIKPLDWKFA